MHEDRSSDGAFSQWAAAAGDRDLLARFVRHADERAFAEIVRRHGAMVLGVCRRVLRHRHAAEDAFQATFLVLARSARRIRRARSLASWLHSVAYRIARRSLADSHRRKEQAVPMETVTSNNELLDVGALYEQQLLDEELQELPEKYREPLVLHHLQGLSQQEVADRLGMSVSAVDGRLKRGRKQLKMRLLRRGVEFGAVLTAVGLGQSAVQAASIEPLVALTTQAVAAVHAGSATPATVSPQAAHLAGKELTLMTGSTKLVATLGISAVVVTLIGLAAGSAGAVPGAPDRAMLPLLSTVADGVTMERTGDVLAQADDVQPVPDTNEAGRSGLHDEIDRLSRELADLAASVRANSAEVHDQRVELQKSIDSLTRQVAALQDQDVSLSEESELGEDTISDEQKSRMPVREPALDYASSGPTDCRIEEALEAETTFEFPGNPLRDVAEYIGDLHNIPIRMDGPALFDEGISTDEEVSFVISGIRLRSALDLLLKSVAGVPLDYVVENEVLTITTRDNADRILDTRVYNLRHLSGSYSPEEVARIVRSTIRPWTWRTEGGVFETPGVSSNGEVDVDERFQASVEALPDALVVTQSQRIHREVVELLQQLHRHDPESTTSALITAAVNERLDELVEVAFSDVPWRTIVSAVAQDHGLNVVFNEAAIADAGLTGNEDVTIAVTDVTLRSVFKLVLEQVGLAIVVEDEVIKVTMPDNDVENTGAGVQARTNIDEPADAAVASPVSVASDDRRDSASNRIEPRNSASVQRINEALDSETSLRFPGNPLQDVVEYIRQIHNIPITLDTRSLTAGSVPLDAEVRLFVSGVILRDALGILLEDVGGVPLDFVIRNEVMTITTREKADRTLDTRAYDLRGLTARCSPSEVARIVRSTIHPSSWREAGAVAERSAAASDVDDGLDQASLEALADTLVVTQSQRVHREIASLLDQLRRIDAGPDGSGALPEDPNTWIELALDESTTFEFLRDPLADAVQTVSNYHNTPIRIDERHLADAGISPNDEVSLVISGIRLRSALQLLLEDVGGAPLDYVIQHGAVTITTLEEAERTPATRVYSVADLTPALSSDDLALAIRNTIRPWTWRIVDQNGVSVREASPGVHVDGRIQASIEVLPDALVITQSQPAHREIAELLNQIRHDHVGSYGSETRSPAPDEPLNELTFLNYRPAPLRVVLDRISRKHGIETRTANQELEALGVSADDDVFIAVKGVTLDSALDTLLADVGGVKLGWFYDNRRIEVTTPAAAASSISGVIRIQGAVPVLPPLVVAGDPNVPSASTISENVPDRSLVVGDGNGLANVFVWLESVPNEVTIPPAPIRSPSIHAHRLQYFPRHLIARTGEQIRVADADRRLDVHAHTWPLQNPPIDEILPDELEGVMVQFDHPESVPVRLTDDLLPTRLGFVLPLDHPFADLTDEAGQFHIRQLPPGDYELTIWHERAGYLERNLSVTVPEEGPAEVGLEFDVARFLDR